MTVKNIINQSDLQKIVYLSFAIYQFGSQSLDECMEIIKNNGIGHIDIGLSHCVFSDMHDNVYGFGSNSLCQLGLPHKGIYQNIVKLNNGIPWKHTDGKITQIQCSTNQTYIVMESGNMYVSGLNSIYQLGIKSRKKKYHFILNYHLKKSVNRIYVLHQHIIAELKDHSYRTWGSNSFGSLGLGMRKSKQKIPHKIHLKHDEIQQIAVLAFGTLILKKNGDVLFCGYYGLYKFFTFEEVKSKGMKYYVDRFTKIDPLKFGNERIKKIHPLKHETVLFETLSGKYLFFGKYEPGAKQNDDQKDIRWFLFYDQSQIQYNEQTNEISKFINENHHQKTKQFNQIFTSIQSVVVH